MRAHVEHAERFVTALGSDLEGLALDLGTGAGVPGLILARRWPRTRWLLLDSRQRRLGPLTDAVERLGLGDRVEVRCERAEETGQDPAFREAFDLVVARSFAAPAVTAECGGALVAVGGRLAVSEPPAADPSDPSDPAHPTHPGHPLGSARWPVAPLLALGLAPVPSPTPQVQLLAKVAPTPADRPRRVGLPGKRPIF